MALAGREVAVVGAGIGGLAAAIGAGAARRAGHALRAGAGARRGRRRHPDRAERGGGARGARARAPRPSRTRACPRRSSSATIAPAGWWRGCRSGRRSRRRATGGRTGSSTAPICSPSSPPARPRPGSSSGSGPACSAWRRHPTRVRLRTAGGESLAAEIGDRGRRRALGRSAPRTSPAAPARFTGHVAWRGLVPAARLPASLRGAGHPGDHGAGAPPRQLSAARRAARQLRRDRGARRLDRRGLDDARRSREPPPRLRRLGRRRPGRCSARSTTPSSGASSTIRRCARWSARADRAPRRRLPPDAALPRAGRDDGAGGRLGAGGGARRAPATRRRASPPTRPRDSRAPPGSSAPRRAAARLYHLRPGLREPAHLGARRGLDRGACATRSPLRLAVRPRRDLDGLTPRAAFANLAGPGRAGERRDAMDSAFLSAFFQVIMIDLVLAGDNAVVIGLAAAGLPPDLRRKAILIGIVAATLMRIGFALIATQLLSITGLLLAGGLLLLWVCWKMYEELRVSHKQQDIGGRGARRVRHQRRRHDRRPARRARRCARRSSRSSSPTSRCRSTTCSRSRARRASTRRC